MDYRKNLKITDDTKYYQTVELDDTNLISLSSRSYPLVINSFVPSELETDNIEVSIRIDKAGRLVYDSLNVENNMAIIREIKSLEPFIPATKDGEIVNAEYKVLIKRE
ncbi:hypothetical protein EYV94_14640 [Puteibacter caeruleilacunae]|nr:hypothetical protein EYV94_14640 [Puteibacter caeruleilacunae]